MEQTFQSLLQALGRMVRLDGITDWMDMSLGELRELVMDRDMLPPPQKESESYNHLWRVG